MVECDIPGSERTRTATSKWFLVQLLLSGLLVVSAAIGASPPGTAQQADPVLDQPNGEWPVYAGTYNSRRYSPLREVTIANAHLLQVKWVYHVADSHELEMTPVVKDGVMYIAQYNRMDAIDARTGNVLWRYQRHPPHRRPIAEPRFITARFLLPPPTRIWWRWMRAMARWYGMCRWMAAAALGAAPLAVRAS